MPSHGLVRSGGGRLQRWEAGRESGRAHLPGGRAGGLDQVADRADRAAIGEGPVQQRGGGTPAAVRAGHLAHDVGLASPGGRADEGVLCSVGEAGLDTDRAPVVVEQPVVAADPDGGFQLAVDGQAAFQAGSLCADVATEVGELHRGPADQRQVVGAAGLADLVQAAGVLVHGVERAEIHRGRVHLLQGHRLALVGTGEGVGRIVARDHQQTLQERSGAV